MPITFSQESTTTPNVGSQVVPRVEMGESLRLANDVVSFDVGSYALMLENMGASDEQISGLSIIFDGAKNSEGKDNNNKKTWYGSFNHEKNEIKLFINSMKEYGQARLAGRTYSKIWQDVLLGRMMESFVGDTLIHETGHFLSRNVLQSQPSGVDRISAGLNSASELSLDLSLSLMDHNDPAVQDLHPLYAAYPVWSAMTLVALNATSRLLDGVRSRYYNLTYDASPEEKFALDCETVNEHLQFVSYKAN